MVIQEIPAAPLAVANRNSYVICQESCVKEILSPSCRCLTLESYATATKKITPTKKLLTMESSTQRTLTTRLSVKKVAPGGNISCTSFSQGARRTQSRKQIQSECCVHGPLCSWLCVQRTVGMSDDEIGGPE